MKNHIQNQINDLESIMETLAPDQIKEKIHYLRKLAKKHNLEEYFQDEFYGLEMNLWEIVKQ